MLGCENAASLFHISAIQCLVAIINYALRWLNPIVTPIGVGLMMSALGAWRLQRGQSLIRIDQFAYGYLFALSIALVRFWFAK